MAMATGESTTPYVPPGNRALISVTTEYAPERVRGWLAEPRMEAFGLDPATGREYIIPVELWRSDQAAEVLRTGKCQNLVLLVRDFDRPPDHVFMPPDERENFPPRRSPEPVEPTVAPEPAEPEPKPEPAPPDLRTPEAESARHPGGKEPDHDWEGAACYVDGIVDDKVQGRKPLPRNKQGEPIVQRAMDLMKDYFDKHDPPPPEDRSIRRWIKDNPARAQKWWDAE
jgi:hypothetical protein